MQMEIEKKPTVDQLLALVRFAEQNGRRGKTLSTKRWKEKLSTAWANGKDASMPDGYLLRQLRNELGPQWLVDVNLIELVRSMGSSINHPHADYSMQDAVELALSLSAGTKPRCQFLSELQEVIAASVQEANSRSLFVLTVVTVLALPINILAGLFGMNVGGVPLADNGHGFWIIVAVVAAFTAVAGWLALRGTRDQ